MVYTGFLNLGGREIVNVARTKAYVDLLLPSLMFENCAECDDLNEALGHKRYTTPLVDRPSWFDPDNPDTWDFYGLFPLSFEGFEDATTTATVTEFVQDGGAVSTPRRATRSLRVTGLLVGLNQAALSTGMVWLRQVLRPGACNVNQACGGDHLTYFVACPPMCEDSPDLVGQQLEVTAGTRTEVRECGTGAQIGPISACTLPYERHLYNTTVVDGPRITETYDPMCGAMAKVEFTLVAGVPSPFGTAVQLTSVKPNPATLPSVPDDIPCDPGSSATIVQRTNLAPNPAPTTNEGWQTLDSTYWTNVVTAGANVRSTRTALGGWAPKILGAVAFAGAYGTDTAMMPLVTPGNLYTISLSMAPSVNARGYLEVQGVNAAGQNVGSSLFSASDVVPPTGTRMSLAIEPVAGVVGLRISARMESDVGNALIGSSATFSQALVEVGNAVNPYFDGGTVSTEPNIRYDWVGVAGHSPSRLIESVYIGPIIDPDCPPVPTPPRPPVVDDSCIDDVDTYKRFTVNIPDDVVPQWSDLVPILNLTTTNKVVRQLRVRFYSNPEGYPVDKLVPCSFIGEFIVSYLPAYSTMTIDGTSRDVIITGATGNANAASHLLYGSGGGPVSWPYMSCGSEYSLAVDIDPSATGLTFELCVAARE
ncbi:MAG: hypothetical protein ABWZ30_05520 [Jiangellaceae bacterium]